MNSPCNQTCRLDQQTGYCEGCGRNVAEIQEWPNALETRKQQILSALPARLESLTASRLVDELNSTLASRT
ncbi:DUF1289 domain-containing protein [Blastomonas aquatica]